MGSKDLSLNFKDKTPENVYVLLIVMELKTTARILFLLKKYFYLVQYSLIILQ